jgi:hypothetical protein
LGVEVGVVGVPLTASSTWSMKYNFY